MSLGLIRRIFLLVRSFACLLERIREKSEISGLCESCVIISYRRTCNELCYSRAPPPGSLQFKVLDDGFADVVLKVLHQMKKFEAAFHRILEKLTSKSSNYSRSLQTDLKILAAGPQLLVRTSLEKNNTKASTANKFSLLISGDKTN